VTTKSFPEVISEIVRNGGIAIPAHVNKNKGLLTTFSGTTLKQAIEYPDLFAMELGDPAWTKPALYTDTKAAWTEVLGSDSHHPAGNTGQKYPGSRFTWVKMGYPSIEGLRLALLDGTLSVKRSDQTTDDPNDHGALVIEDVTIAEARYMGRSSGGNAAEVETRLQFLKTNLRAIASGKHNAFDLKDQRFATHMGKLPPEALGRLDVWFPEDSLQVEYNTEADGSSFRSIQEGSPGQKTAALLAFLLSYGGKPIILD
jgi:hypothetical protein